MKTLELKAAAAVDATLDAATRKYGVYTNSARETLAKYLDGGNVRTSYVRKLIGYLNMVSRSYPYRPYQ